MLYTVKCRKCGKTADMLPTEPLVREIAECGDCAWNRREAEAKAREALLPENERAHAVLVRWRRVRI